MKEKHEMCRSQDFYLGTQEKKKPRLMTARPRIPVRFIKFRQKRCMFIGRGQSTNCTVCPAIDEIIKHQRMDEKVEGALKSVSQAIIQSVSQSDSKEISRSVIQTINHSDSPVISQ
jgi:hypothetical protein